MNAGVFSGVPENSVAGMKLLKNRLDVGNDENGIAKILAGRGVSNYIPHSINLQYDNKTKKEILKVPYPELFFSRITSSITSNLDGGLSVFWTTRQMVENRANHGRFTKKSPTTARDCLYTLIFIIGLQSLQSRTIDSLEHEQICRNIVSTLGKDVLITYIRVMERDMEFIETASTIIGGKSLHFTGTALTDVEKKKALHFIETALTVIENEDGPQEFTRWPVLLEETSTSIAESDLLSNPGMNVA